MSRVRASDEIVHELHELHEGLKKMEKKAASSKVLYAELGYQLQGIFYEVHNVLGPGFREETYRQAVIRELKRRSIPFATECSYDIDFKGENIDRYRADLVVEDKIIVELKAVIQMPAHFEAYLLSYLRTSKLRLGYLVNFGAPSLQIVRRIL